METTTYALVTNQGTAMAETALCESCLPDNRDLSIIEARLSGDWDEGEFVDCTGNDALSCMGCGGA